MMKEDLPFSDALFAFYANTLGLRADHAMPVISWNEQMRGLSYYGRGMEEALNFLFEERPGFEGFVDWLKMAIQPVKAPLPVENILTKEDRLFWEENGFIVVKEVVPRELCEAAKSAIWELLGASSSQPESWYKEHPGKKGLMLAFFQHPALHAIRNAPAIHKAYLELYGQEDIYLPVDKVSFNPPVSGSFTFLGSPLHWDVSLQPPIPFELQGLLYLNDTSATDGAFHCVPGFHKKLEEWLDGIPDGMDPREVALQTLQPLPVPGNAGDLIIWHQALPHCATPNKGKSPRFVQYITYKPVNAVEQAFWK